MSHLCFHVKSVIFDMDGVITNTMPDHYRSWKRIFSDCGIDVSHEDIYKREGQPGINSVKEIFTEHNKPFDHRLASSILKRKEQIFKSIVKIRFITGARSFLRKLDRQNIRLALVTGTSRHELNRILPKELRALFSVSVTGDEVTHGKPHPEPYLKSIKALGIRSDEAVVIENAPFGIRSAKGAGIKCLAVATSLSKEYLKGADAIFTSIRDLDKKVRFLNSNHHE